MEKIALARIIKNESMLVEKNNDYFLEENHDHSLFYRYSSLYDIAQLLLPIAVVVTSLIFDTNNKQPMTVEQLYLILSMLGICYRPMKDFRTFSISLSDGFHSLRRITDYLELPEEENLNTRYKRINLQPAEITIAKGTVGRVEGRGIDIEL
jgi:ABC-type multidrug transport system fused ATPase/permease subunit